MAQPEKNLWTDKDWAGPLGAIRNKLCTPFLGAGACAGLLPMGADIAQKLALKYGYPFDDTSNLPRVAQYVAIHEEGAALLPKTEILDLFNPLIENLAKSDYAALTGESAPHRLLADLELPLYITTNYDDFMMEALRRNVPPSRTAREPRREVCAWDTARRRRRANESALAPLPKPEIRAPIVYHLHGVLDRPDSMVLTEDDYLDFLVYMAEEPRLIAERLQDAFASTVLLFVGYSLEDLNFKVLLRQLGSYMQMSESTRHVAVQLAPSGHESDAQLQARALAQQNYLQKKYNLQKVRVYWGTGAQFMDELRRKLWPG